MSVVAFASPTPVFSPTTVFRYPVPSSVFILDSVYEDAMSGALIEDDAFMLDRVEDTRANYRENLTSEIRSIWADRLREAADLLEKF